MEREERSCIQCLSLSIVTVEKGEDSEESFCIPNTDPEGIKENFNLYLDSRMGNHLTGDLEEKKDIHLNWCFMRKHAEWMPTIYNFVSWSHTVYDVRC
ncbi:hypothetical protein KY285_026510 [Solanum tuberosum]|nr:hypothetical protein KY284_026592 [Solanum tuberosum]KAH0665304.1 hypothetical protein KY285_026510 [Solanum tuberosum]